MDKLLIPAEECRTEIIIKKSTFISTISPTSSVNDARDFIKRIKAEFKDATHNVSAFIIGFGSSVIEHCSDDGEPNGTAGKPILSALRGSGFGDVVLVVTRYFGGVKLGTGGLARAYSEAANQVLSMTPPALKVPTYNISITIPYSLFEKISNLLKKHHAKIMHQSFSTEIYLEANINLHAYKFFEKDLTHLSNGKIFSTILSTEESIRLLDP